MSCSTPAFRGIDESGRLDVEVFQTLGNAGDASWALCHDRSWNVCQVVWVNRTGTGNGSFYDGKRITGKYVLVGLYSYTTPSGRYKVVPTFMRKTDRDYWYWYDIEHGTSFLDRWIRIFCE